MTHTTVSVIVPTKNSAGTLPACLKALSEQTYPNVEIIVVDNFSTDATPQIARQFTQKFYQRGPERSAQRNYGVKKASGRYVAIIDSDMELSPEVIAQCVERIETDNTLKGIVIPEESFGEGFWAQCKKFERSFYVGVSYMEAARFFARDTFIDVGGYEEDMVSGEDWDLSQRVEKLGPLGRINAYIYHNEGRISLIKTMRKKYYYAQKFATYQAKNKGSAVHAKQTGIIGRYLLFFSHPLKLLRHPILSIGMLFMKTCEFGFGGLGYLLSRQQAGVSS